MSTNTVANIVAIISGWIANLVFVLMIVIAGANGALLILTPPIIVVLAALVAKEAVLSFIERKAEAARERARHQEEEERQRAAARERQRQQEEQDRQRAEAARERQREQEHQRVQERRRQQEERERQRNSSHGGRFSVAQALEILSLNAGATEQEIRAAYNRLMKRVHPDVGGSSFFAKQLNEARDLLLDEQAAL
jgi:flagellar biosynthesis GTPase FlhF